MTVTPTPASRRERPAKPALSRDGIVAAALTLMHREGLERVTMRRLAADLDTGPASLYVYVRDTGDLHAAVLDAVLGEVDLHPADTDWEDAIVGVLTSYTGVLFRHPGLARAAVVTRPCGPHSLAVVERLLALLTAGGIPADRAAWAVNLLLQQATATAAEHGNRSRADERRQFDDLRTAIQGAPAAEYPRIAAAATALLSGTGVERLAWGFRVLLAGARHAPRPA